MFSKNSKGYIHMYDGYREDKSLSTKLKIIGETIVFTIICSVLLIVPFIMFLTITVINKGMDTSFGLVMESLPKKAFMLSLTSLLLTIPYGFYRKKKYGNKAFVTAFLTVFLLTVVLTIVGFVITTLGIFGIDS